MQETVAQGESVLNSAMAAWVFDYYARMLTYASEDAARISQIRQKRAEASTAPPRARNGPANGCGAPGSAPPSDGWAKKALARAATLGHHRRRHHAAQSESPDRHHGRSAAPPFAHRRHADERSPDIAKHGEVFVPGTSVSGGIWPSLNAPSYGLSQPSTPPWPGMSGRRIPSRATPKSIPISGTAPGAAPTPQLHRQQASRRNRQ